GGPNGEMLFEYDPNRVNRFLWKVARGLYTLDTSGLLPSTPPDGIELVSPRTEAEKLPGWFPQARNTEPLGRYGRVFDYKWIGWVDAGIRGHALAMNFWDGLVATMVFHDVRCACGQCEDWKNGA